MTSLVVHMNIYVQVNNKKAYGNSGIMETRKWSLIIMINKKSELSIFFSLFLASTCSHYNLNNHAICKILIFWLVTISCFHAFLMLSQSYIFHFCIYFKWFFVYLFITSINFLTFTFLCCILFFYPFVHTVLSIQYSFPLVLSTVDIVVQLPFQSLNYLLCHFTSQDSEAL